MGKTVKYATGSGSSPSFQIRIILLEGRFTNSNFKLNDSIYSLILLLLYPRSEYTIFRFLFDLTNSSVISNSAPTLSVISALCTFIFNRLLNVSVII